jgi:hypothetical protein
MSDKRKFIYFIAIIKNLILIIYSSPIKTLEVHNNTFVV